MGYEPRETAGLPAKSPEPVTGRRGGVPDGQQPALSRAGGGWSAKMSTRLHHARAKYRWLNLAMLVREHDRLVRGGLLAEAVTFRLFLWFLPAALIVVAGLGLLTPRQDQNVSQGGSLQDAITSAIAQASAQTHRTHWIAVLVGSGLVLLASDALARTLSTAVAAVWQMDAPVDGLWARLLNAVVLAVVLGIAIATGVLASALRSSSFAASLFTDVGAALLWAVIWWRVQQRLPHPPAVPPRQLWAGAVLMGAGFQLLHVVAVVYLSPRIASATRLYGTLGGITVILLWSYMSARLLLLSSTLNAALVSRQDVVDVEDDQRR